MQRRWFPYLLSGMLCLLLLPATALAENPNPNLNNRIQTLSSRTANNQSNRSYRNGALGTRTAPQANHGGFSQRIGALGTRTPPGNNGGFGYPNNNGYYGNPTYGQGGYWGYGDRDYWRYRHHDRRDRCVDPDHDGDCDFIRHRHRRWHDDDADDRGYYGGWGDRGWGHHDNGRHRGWYKHARHDEDEDDD